jgi:hypothetical protein
MKLNNKVMVVWFKNRSQTIASSYHRSSSIATGMTSKLEMPCKTWGTFSPKYMSGSLDEARSVLMEDIGAIPLVSLEFFCKSVLPEVPSDTVTSIANDMRRDGCITGGRWHDASK